MKLDSSCSHDVVPGLPLVELLVQWRGKAIPG